MRAARATPAAVDPIAEAQGAVDAAVSAEATLRADLEGTEAEASRVAAAFLRDPSQIEANMRATMLADRARALHVEGVAAVEAARAVLAKAERARLAEQHEVDRRELVRWRDGLAPLHAQLVTLDAHLDDLVLAYAKHVLDARAAYDAATARAKQLGQRLDVPRPELADAQLEASRSARLAREQAGRDCLSDWLAPELGAGDWRVDGTARERADAMRERERSEREGAAMLAQQVEITRRRLAAAATETANTATEGN